MRYCDGVNFIASMQIATTNQPLIPEKTTIFAASTTHYDIFFGMTKTISNHQYSNQKYVKSIQLLQSFWKHRTKSSKFFVPGTSILSDFREHKSQAPFLWIP